MTDNATPCIVEERDSYAVVFKPPKMHSDFNASAPENESLARWGLSAFPLAAGRGGGLVHRLDFETQGLVLFAKNRESLAFFRALQESGGLVKEYGAFCEKSPNGLPGFPPAPVFLETRPFAIESYFRPFGPGRKEVRPVIGETRKDVAKDRGGFYRTEVVGAEDGFFRVMIKRGFRHQIRCHLSWLGYPIAGDPIYASPPASPPPAGKNAFLALCAQAIFFADPETGQKRECRSV